MRLVKYISFLFLILGLNSCLKGQAEEQVIYSNNFESNGLLNGQSDHSASVTFVNAEERFFQFNGSRNLGRFERGGVILDFDDLFSHDFVRVEFDYYIHDNWEGNGQRGNGEDVIIFNIDKTSVYFSSIINTKCQGHDCTATQSFPDKIKTRTNPENAEIADSSLPGVCFWEGQSGGSKRIRITELRPHTANSLSITIGADIKDAGPDLCFKSWSVDNIKITTLSIPNL